MINKPYLFLYSRQYFRSIHHTKKEEARPLPFRLYTWNNSSWIYFIGFAGIPFTFMEFKVQMNTASLSCCAFRTNTLTLRHPVSRLDQSAALYHMCIYSRIDLAINNRGNHDTFSIRRGLIRPEDDPISRGHDRIRTGCLSKVYSIMETMVIIPVAKSRRYRSNGRSCK